MPGPARCPVCGDTVPAPFFTLAGVPVHANIAQPTRLAALAAPRADVELGLCRTCGHISNLVFDAATVAYGPGYENSLHHSARFDDYVRGLAARLVARYALERKNVLEIGCGRGEFLEILCAEGGNFGVGLDTVYDGPDRRTGEARGRPYEVLFVRDLFSEAYADCEADIVCCRHVLEHVAEPLPFLAAVRRAVTRRPGAVAFFEVPNAAAMLRGACLWDAIYEHRSYFALPSLRRLFVEAGLEPLRLYTSFDDQFLCIEAAAGPGRPGRNGNGAAAGPGLPGDIFADGADGGDGGGGRSNGARPGAAPDDEHAVADLAVLARSFAAGSARQVDLWRDRVERLLDAGRRVVAWGAGSKGVTFLNLVGAAGRIDCIVDQNPRKHGLFVPGTGQRIIPPEALLHVRPDAVLLMNRVYEEEVRGRLRGLSPAWDVEVVSV